MRSIILSVPGVSFLIRHLRNLLFPGSEKYWERRYRWSGTSGAGSYGDLAAFKADFVNDFVRENGIESVIEFGCGDGNQLKLARYPSYIGLDISKRSIAMVSEYFKNDPTKKFILYDPHGCQDDLTHLTADCALSMDVIYHLIEDEVFEKYMSDLFRAARKFVIIYSSNCYGPLEGHVKQRRFSDFVDAKWKSFELVQRLPNKYPEKTFAEFFVYEKTDHDRAS